MKSLPPFPPTAMRVVELANTPTSTAKELIEVIRLDPVLTAKILKLVNSSFFSLTQKVSSLKRALILLGFNTVKNIALSSAMISALKEKVTGKHQNLLNDLWIHMLAVGVGSREIALKSQAPNEKAEEYFLCGLLSELGTLLLISRIYHLYEPLEKVSQKNNISMAMAVKKSLGLSPAEITVIMLEEWKLPESVLSTMQDIANGTSFCPVGNAVQLSDKIARKLYLGYVCDLTNLDINPSDLGLNGITLEDLNSIEEELPSLTDSAMFLLETAS